jgi:hypothetical protein
MPAAEARHHPDSRQGEIASQAVDSSALPRHKDTATSGIDIKTSQSSLFNPRGSGTERIVVFDTISELAGKVEFNRDPGLSSVQEYDNGLSLVVSKERENMPLGEEGFKRSPT